MWKQSLFAAVAVFAAAGALSGAESTSKPYLDIYAKRLEMTQKYLASPKASRPRREDPRSEPSSAIMQSHMAYTYGKATGKQEYIDLGLQLYDLMAEMNPKFTRGSDFHYTRPWAIMTVELKKDGKLTGKRLETAKKLCADFQGNFVRNYRPGVIVGAVPWQSAMFDHNIHQAEMTAGLATAMLFPELPGSKAAKEIVDRFIDRILKTGDLNEDATNYAPLGFCFFYDLLKMAGREKELAANPRFKNQIARWRDFNSPNGFYAEIGDSYFKHQLIPIDVLVMLEVGARTFNEPSFAAKAAELRKLYHDKETDDTLSRGLSLMTLKPYRYDASDVPPKTLSQVTTRYRFNVPGKALYDKLILRTGNNPGDAMMMVNLYADGSHAHAYRRPSVAYYEYGGMPLFHNLGRRGTLGGNCGDVFFLADRAESFPGHMRENVWNTMVIPVKNLAYTDIPGVHVFKKSLDFRTFEQPKCEYVIFDNLRLEGRAGVKMIDSFDSPDLWSNHAKRYPIETVEGRDGKGNAQKVTWNLFKAQVVHRFLPAEWQNVKVNEKDYEFVKFDFLYKGQAPMVNLRGWCEQWMDLGSVPLLCDVASAEVKQSDAGAFGRADFVNYMEQGNSLSRRFALGGDGVLTVVDLYTPGAASKLPVAGQLWQLYTLKEKGKDFFASESDGEFAQLDKVRRPERRMLVKYFLPDGAEAGVEEVSPSGMHAYAIKNGKLSQRYTKFYTTYSKVPVKKGEKLTLVQVVYPLRAMEDASRVAAKIAFRKVADGAAVVTYPSPADGKTVTLELNGGNAVFTR